MKLIIGGAYQGKKAYASREYQIKENMWADGATCQWGEVLSTPAVHNFHILIRRLLQEGTDVVSLGKELYEKNPQIVVVTDEVGYGIVPMEAEERAWREECGRVCTVLAQQAEEVVRVCCGIGRRIKG